jgi:hypothetical protein
MRKRQKASTDLVVRVAKWGFVYTVTDDRGVVIYVGKTCNERSRAVQHQKTATSNCKRLAREIERLSLIPTWSFQKNFHRAPGLAHGLPDNLLDLYEAFFIERINGQGTIHSLQNASGCNSREGNNAVVHEEKFDEIQTALDALGADENLWTEKDHIKFIKTSYELADAAANLNILTSIRDACCDESTTIPECVQVAYTLSLHAYGTIGNVEQTRLELKRAREIYAKARPDEKVDRVQFAMEWNAIGALLHEYMPNEDNYRQQISHQLVSKVHQSVQKLTGNGEISICSELPSLTPLVILDAVRMLSEAVKIRDESGGMHGSSFGARLAWCQPDSKLKGDLNTNLQRVDKLLSEPGLNEDQVRRAEEYRQKILSAIASTSVVLQEAGQ